MKMALVHKHLIVRAETLNTPKDPEWAVNWLNDLVNKINMKVMYGPVAKYSEMVGNRGLTAFTIIETSHIVLHVWDETYPGTMQLDLYTCGPFDPQIIFNEVEKFSPTTISYKYLDREHGLEEIPIQ